MEKRNELRETYVRGRLLRSFSITRRSKIRKKKMGERWLVTRERGGRGREEED